MLMGNRICITNVVIGSVYAVIPHKRENTAKISQMKYCEHTASDAINRVF